MKNRLIDTSSVANVTNASTAGAIGLAAAASFLVYSGVPNLQIAGAALYAISAICAAITDKKGA